MAALLQIGLGDRQRQSGGHLVDGTALVVGQQTEGEQREVRERPRPLSVVAVTAEKGLRAGDVASQACGREGRRTLQAVERR